MVYPVYWPGLINVRNKTRFMAVLIFSPARFGNHEAVEWRKFNPTLVERYARWVMLRQWLIVGGSL